MAESLPSPVLEQLEVALVQPEPMCLVMVRVEAGGARGTDQDLRDGHAVFEGTGVLDEAGVRLRSALRLYDEMIEVRPNSWAVIMKTLADATALAGRMRTFYDIVSEPYFVNGQEISVQIVLGAAVRVPQDTPGRLVERVEQAMRSARDSGAIGPVVV